MVELLDGNLALEGSHHFVCNVSLHDKPFERASYLRCWRGDLPVMRALHFCVLHAALAGDGASDSGRSTLALAAVRESSSTQSNVPPLRSRSCASAGTKCSRCAVLCAAEQRRTCSMFTALAFNSPAPDCGAQLLDNASSLDAFSHGVPAVYLARAIPVSNALRTEWIDALSARGFAPKQLSLPSPLMLAVRPDSALEWFPGPDLIPENFGQTSMDLLSACIREGPRGWKGLRGLWCVECFAERW